MENHSPAQYWRDEIERNAYNAAFFELGLRWHWDGETYDRLMGLGQNANERIGHYLKTHQPHLLKAYDAEFLALAIEQKKEIHKKREMASSSYFNWAESHGVELGA